MRLQSSLKLADLGTANFTYSRQDADFHRLQERLSRGLAQLKTLTFRAG